MNQYDLLASLYEKLMGDLGDLPNKYLLNPILLKHLPQDKNLYVLDAGCGSGRWTKVLAGRYDKVIGVDNSKELLKIAKNDRSAANISYSFSDLENPLPFEDNIFDLIFSNMVVHYLSNMTKIANEFYRILKSNGTLLFSTHHPKFDLARYKFLKQVNKRTKFVNKDSLKGKAAVTRYYEPIDLFIKHFIDAGFILISQEDRIITPEFEKIYPRYRDYVGLPRFTVFKFQKK